MIFCILPVFLAATASVVVEVDASSAPEQAQWAENELEPTLKKWYPRLIAEYPSKDWSAPEKVKVGFVDPPQTGAPAYTTGDSISLDRKWFSANRDSEGMGCAIHELMHVVQSYPGGGRSIPWWLTEGIADYVRWYVFEPEKKGCETDLSRMDVRYDGGYRQTANFLDYVERKHPGTVRSLNAVGRLGRYSPGVWRRITGRELWSLGGEWKGILDADAPRKPGDVVVSAAEAFVTAYWDCTRSQFVKHKGKNELLDYWLSAHAYEMLLDLAVRYPRNDFRGMAEMFFDGFKAARGDWRANEFNDDLLWWVIADCHAYRVLKTPALLKDAREMMDFIIGKQCDGVLGGGVWWKSSERGGKHACSCYPAVIAACELYSITGDRKYLEAASSIYAWSRENLFDKSAGCVFDAKHADGKVDRTCYTYNVGTAIGAALRLGKLTGAKGFREDAALAADWLMDRMSRGEVMRGRGQGDGGAFNGIAARYLAEFAALPQGARAREYLKINARTAFAHMRKADGLCGPDWDVAPADGFDIEAQTACSALTLFLCAPEGTFSRRPAGVVRTMTYNIRNSHDDRGSENDWAKRRDDLVAVIRAQDPDVIGFQEVLPDQREWLMEQFKDYVFVGDGRGADRKSDESASIAFRKNRFTAVDKGTFWLSETPDTPGKKGWGAACPRVCSYAILKDKSTGKAFCFANTHTDHVSELAREKGMLLVIERMKVFGKGAPIVFTGDHNCQETEAPAIAVSKLLRNAMAVSKTPPMGPWRSFTGWKWRDWERPAAKALSLPRAERNAPGGDFGSRIDYIYVSPGVKVRSCRTVSTPRPGRNLYPSDHFPVVADVEF